MLKKKKVKHSRVYETLASSILFKQIGFQKLGIGLEVVGPGFQATGGLSWVFAGLREGTSPLPPAEVCR